MSAMGYQSHGLQKILLEDRPLKFVPKLKYNGPWLLMSSQYFPRTFILGYFKLLIPVWRQERVNSPSFFKYLFEGFKNFVVFSFFSILSSCIFPFEGLSPILPQSSCSKLYEFSLFLLEFSNEVFCLRIMIFNFFIIMPFRKLLLHKQVPYKILSWSI